MTPADLTLNRELVATPGWMWMSGMRTTDGLYILALVDGTEMLVWDEERPEWETWHHDPTAEGDLPDLDDPATGGILLDWLGPGWTVYRTTTAWTCRETEGQYPYAATEPSLGRACAQAMVARGWVTR